MAEPNGSVPTGLVRDVLREVLSELLPGALAGAAPAPGETVPQVPPPPVAAVHRPSTYSGPDPWAPAPGGEGAERVSISNDAELDAFVKRVLRLAEDPRERAALRAGRRRFTLGGPGEAPGQAGVLRVERGAVTERMVDEAAAAGARLLLGRRAVATPLARDRARRLGVEIQKEA